MDHVHLIVIAEFMRDMEPRPLGRLEFGVKRCLEACDPRKSFRGDANFSGESPFELPDARSGVLRQRVDAACASVLK